MNKKTYTVKQLNAYIKNMFASDFLLQRVCVSGEVSNFKDHPSGHIYFTLKDADATLSVVMFRSDRLRGLKCRLKEGMKVEVTGSVSIYEAGGRYQLYAKTIEEVGIGDLYRRFEELKNRLEEMGMFDASFKKPIPKYAMRVGIVTSDSGAALQDILNIARRRNPSVELILSPCLVQGEYAPLSIVKALEKLDENHPDVIILGRGGGSMEDLWCFNDERVARAIFDCDTPVISAVGHEVDFTIADFVADLRAPTPSAAAELSIFDRQAVMDILKRGEVQMGQSLKYRLDTANGNLEKLKMQLKMLHPENRLKDKRMHLLDLEEELQNQMVMKLTDRKVRLGLLSERLNAGSPLKKLTGGFGYISKNNQALKSAASVKPGDIVKIVLSDGSFSAEVQGS